MGPAAGARRGIALKDHLGRLWRGELPLSQAFWREMIVVGTLINVAATLLAVVAVAAGASMEVGFVIHLLPLPWNILLFQAVWQSAARESPEWRWLARFCGIGWFAASFLI